MIDRGRFYAEFDVDPQAAERALARDARGATWSVPWYVRAVTAIGAWFTAAAATALGIALVLVVLEIEFDGTLALAGAVYLAAGLAVLRAKAPGPFMTQLGIGLAAAGLALVAAGVWAHSTSLWMATIASCGAATVAVFVVPDRTLQFLAGLLCAVLFGATLVDWRSNLAFDLAALAGPAGLFLVLRPTRRDLRPLAVVLLTLYPVFSILLPDAAAFRADAPWAAGSFARVLHIGLLLWLIGTQLWHPSDENGRLPWIGACAAAIVVGLLSPPGGSAALLVLTLAWVIGSRSLAVLGVVLECIFIWRFYYDLTLTLLAKSGLLVAVGVVLILAWMQLERHRRKQVAAP